MGLRKMVVKLEAREATQNTKKPLDLYRLINILIEEKRTLTMGEAKMINGQISKSMELLEKRSPCHVRTFK